ncbi:MAG: nucleoside triphosphate pyrophosphohydrolase [Chloroflexi bacterium]|nr:nucleoside triphosphate pyrophosphohydrolase [Chloroflexota bacterium]
MQKKRQLLVCGVGITEQTIFTKIQQSDLVLARSELCASYLVDHQIQKFKIFRPELLNGTPIENSVSVWLEKNLSDLDPLASIAYITPFSPMLCDRVVKALLDCWGDEDSVQFYPGVDLTASLIQKTSPGFSSQILSIDGLSLWGTQRPLFSADGGVLIFDPLVYEDPLLLKKLLSILYPLDHPLFQLGSENPPSFFWEQTTLEKLGESSANSSAYFIPPLAQDLTLESFQEVIARLRAPDGCPWDQKQTHLSLRTYLLEETYEALETLDKNDPLGLCEELGDLLLQIVLHAQIAEEKGEFTMAEVLSGINRKIVYRHPHVFKDWIVKGEQDVIQNWESLKNLERKAKESANKKGMLDGVPLSFPALAQAQAIQDRAARVGFDWPDIAPVLEKVFEELDEVRTAENEEERAKELGDLLFAMVNLIRWHKVDAESTLRMTSLKFRKRFAYIEEKARNSQKELSQMTLEEMDRFWEEAKEFDD